jgi:hypothetical protein
LGCHDLGMGRVTAVRPMALATAIALDNFGETLTWPTPLLSLQNHRQSLYMPVQTRTFVLL